MVSLGTRQDRTPTEVLQTSQGYHLPNCAQRAKTAVLTASTWNVHSMVDVEVASQRTDGQRGEDRKIDQIVLEVQRVCGFGDEDYEVNGSALLTAGRPSPAEGAPVVRGEGVVLVSERKIR